MRVRFRGPGQPDPITADTRDIGVGGAFIQTTELQPVGTTLTIDLTIPTTEQVFTLPAVVRWAARDGMGVQFVGVDVDILLELNDYFATIT